MAILHNQVFKDIAESLVDSIAKSYNHEAELEEVYKLIAPAPNMKMGHFTFPCFSLSKLLKASPVQIGGELSKNLTLPGTIEKAQPQGPYLNFFLNINQSAINLIKEIENEDFFTKKTDDDSRKKMIEYSQPNTHKVLHVGHMRNLCLGNALIRMGRYLGQDIVSVTYPGDVGTHVAKCLWYIKYHHQGDLPLENKGEWLAEIYAAGNNKLEEEKGSPKEDENRKQLTGILKELEQESGEFYELWKETREWSLDLMKKTYAWADVEFDRWFFESEVDRPSLEFANKLYSEGKLIKDEGAIGMDLKEDKLGFCLIVKSDGTGLYATKDIELAKLKFEEFKVEQNIYIVDHRQTRHFKQVFKVLEKIGFDQAKDCFHLPYEMVELPEGAMSSRKGLIVHLQSLINEMEKTIQEKYLNRYLKDPEYKDSGWTKAEVDKTSKLLANSAIKYGMIRVDNNRKITFDMEEWRKLDGETGPYLQYVYARIGSLCKKFDYKKNSVSDFSCLTHEKEAELLIKMSQFNDVVVQATQQFKTSLLCSYLYELGKLFNSFYADCPIGKAPSDELRQARLALSYSCAEVMKHGLACLGIETVDRM